MFVMAFDEKGAVFINDQLLPPSIVFDNKLSVAT